MQICTEYSVNTGGGSRLYSRVGPERPALWTQNDAANVCWIYDPHEYASQTEVDPGFWTTGYGGFSGLELCCLEKIGWPPQEGIDVVIEHRQS